MNLVNLLQNRFFVSTFFLNIKRAFLGLVNGDVALKSVIILFCVVSLKGHMPAKKTGIIVLLINERNGYLVESL